MAESTSSLFAPFMIQCFVTSGVAINVAQFGLIAAYVVAIVPQLQQPGSTIPMDIDTASWFASIHSITVIIGNVVVVQLMSRFGRRVANVTSSGLMFVGWVLIVTADSVACLLLGRFLQGVSLGLILALGPVILGECTSPKYRGSFLASTTALMSIGTTLIHILGLVLHWRTIGLLVTVISFINLLISIYSPESPSWLAYQERFDECRKVFRYLRGSGEEEELKQLIEASLQEKGRLVEKRNVKIVIDILKKKEVYKSLVIGVHLYILCYWCGAAVLSSFPIEVINVVIGVNSYMRAILISLDIQRLVTNMAAMYVVHKCKRKTILLITIGMNAMAFFVLAGYSYAKEMNYLPFDHPLIGILLLHLHMITIALGGLPLPIIIVGEIFPLEYRCICSSVTTTISSINLFIVYKTFFQTVQMIRLCGTFIMSGVIVAYSLAVVYYFLPETKDKTLQDIENEFRGASKDYKKGEVFLKRNENILE